MDITSLIIQLLSGAVGGNIVGALAKNLNLGWLMNSLAGIVGGAGGGWLTQILGLGAAAATAGSLDPMAILQQVVSGGAGGGVLMAIAGIVRNMMNKSAA